MDVWIYLDLTQTNWFSIQLRIFQYACNMKTLEINVQKYLNLACYQDSISQGQVRGLLKVRELRRF
jgi:hypothetical protein